jgi:undecaprenyl-diphosphatase
LLIAGVKSPVTGLPSMRGIPGCGEIFQRVSSMWATQTIRLYIESRDQQLMRKVHRWRAPRWVRLWMICSTRLGDGWLWYSLAFVLLVFGGPKGQRALCAEALAVSAGIILFQLAKRLSGRKRPCAFEKHCWAAILPPDQFSFPSGHSITALAVAISVGMYYPDLLSFLLFCSFSISASRIILGMHFFSDVAAGCMLGAGLGYSSFLLIR